MNPKGGVSSRSSSLHVNTTSVGFCKFLQTKPRISRNTSIELSLNVFRWTQWIWWITPKSKSSMVTGCITHLVSNTWTFPEVVIQSTFLLLPLGRYLLPLIIVNRYQTRNSNQIVFFTTTSRMSLVWSVSGIHTTFGFCINSLNSVKVNPGKL